MSRPQIKSAEAGSRLTFQVREYWQLYTNRLEAVLRTNPKAPAKPVHKIINQLVWVHRKLCKLKIDNFGWNIIFRQANLYKDEICALLLRLAFDCEDYSFRKYLITANEICRLEGLVIR